jgi:hypothetical protein
MQTLEQLNVSLLPNVYQVTERFREANKLEM